MLPLVWKTLQWTIHQASFFPYFTQLLKLVTHTTAQASSTTYYPFNHFS